MEKSKLNFRKARLHDLDNLIQLENLSFANDRLSKRSFKSFISSEQDDLIVLEEYGQLIGYALILYKKGSSLARLYSIAIHPNQTGRGLGKKLLSFVEKTALKKGTAYLRLEVASQNLRAQMLYKSMSYYQFNIRKEYYEDNDDALCFEKKLLLLNKRRIRKVKFYRQSTEFTCGPSSLMMAMNTLDPTFEMNQSLELQIWRESTMIFMLSGHGGCGPRGLALAAKRRGFSVEVFVSTEDFLFLNSVRDPKKKSIMNLVQNDFEKQIKKQKIKIRTRKISFDLVSKIVKEGGIPLVLISSYMLTGTKTPHWIVISGVDDNFIYFHDPDVEEGQSDIENINVPIRKDEFNKICKYGTQQLQSLIVLKELSKEIPV